MGDVYFGQVGGKVGLMTYRHLSIKIIKEQ